MYVYLWLIHVDVWQKPTQYCKAIILQLKMNTFFKKESNAGDAKDVGSIPGSGRSPGEGNGNPLQYSFLENFMYRGA